MAGSRFGWLAVIVGCGWDLGAPSVAGPAENRAACTEWVTHVNGLDACVAVTYDARNVCESASAQPPEMAAYYRCLVETAHCEGVEPRLVDPKCTAPLVALDTPQESVRVGTR